MARRWRLRNKLLLGLGLVVGCVGTLIAGTAYGLSSYRSTMKTNDSKLAELLTLDKLKADAAVIVAVQTAPKSTDKTVAVDPAEADQVTAARDRLARSKETFAVYKSQFEDTVRRGRDPDPYQDTQLVAAIEKTFIALEAALDEFAQPQRVTSTSPLATDAGVAKQHDQLLRQIDDLRNEVARDMYERIDRARTDHDRAVGIVAGATGVAVILILTLVSLFSGWVFKPIKDPQAGVRRVTEGDFDHPIDLKSGDELEDLAVAFNG